MKNFLNDTILTTLLVNKCSTECKFKPYNFFVIASFWKNYCISGGNKGLHSGESKADKRKNE